MFTTEQKSAIEDRSKNLIVSAGAGTGKTTLILGRAISLLKENQNKLLITTFTISAKNELVSRLKKLPEIKENPHLMDRVVIVTSGSLAWSVATHYQPDLKHITEGQFRGRIRKILKETGQDFIPQQFATLDVNEANEHKYISYFTNGIMLLTINDVQADDPNIPEDFQAIYKAWTTQRDHDKTYSHSDIQALALKAVREGVIPEKFQGLTDILGDEAQDFSMVQYLLLKALVGEGRLCLVGDSEQTIYSWRGAVPGLLGRYFRHGPGTKIIELTENFRSTRQIIEPSVRVVNSIPGVKKRLTSQVSGEPISVRALTNIKKEADYASEKALALQQAGIMDLSEFAILGRSHYTLNEVFSKLTKLNIPFVYVGGGFFKRPEYKMIRNICDFLADYNSRESLIGLIDMMIDKKVEIPEDVQDMKGVYAYLLDTKQMKGLKAKRIMDALSYCMHLMETDITCDALLNKIISSFHIFEVCSKIKGNRFTAHTLADLRDMSQDYEDIYAFRIGLMEREDTHQGQKPLPGHVFVGTPFAAKGMEFNTVFILGMNDGIFPRSLPDENLVDFRYDVMRSGGIDEECRILFVAMTRAKRNLTMTYSKKSVGDNRELYPSSLFHLGDIKTPR